MGVQRGRAPLAAVWGRPPDTISTPSRPGRGQADARQGFSATSTRLRKKGSPEGPSPFGGGLGVSPRYNFHPLPARKGAGQMLDKGFQQPLAGCGRMGVQRGRAPLAAVWGCPPDTISTPSRPGRGQARCSTRVFSNLYQAAEKGESRGAEPLWRGSGGVPQI